MTRWIATALLAACVWSPGAKAVAPADLPMDFDEHEVRQVLARQVQAWNFHDAQEWAAEFAPDADFTSSLGTTTHGRDVIATVQAALFKGSLRESVLRSDEIDVRFVGKELAIVHWRQTLGGVNAPASYGPRNGTFRVLAVVHKESGKWSIVAMQCVREAGP